ncbi:MAG: OmpA family protein [Endomicrobiia bacterium]
MKNLKLTSIILISVLLLSFFGCPKKVKPPVVEKPQYEIEPQEEPDIRIGEDFVSLEELKNVYFEFDRFDLTEEAKSVLQKNAKFLLDNPQYEILVEGHCCECGSNEYNLALGQKRASVVRDYYINLGVSSRRVATISYGEEKPINKNVAPPDSPLCKPNRRAETKVRVKK